MTKQEHEIVLDALTSALESIVHEDCCDVINGDYPCTCKYEYVDMALLRASRLMELRMPGKDKRRREK